MCVPWQVRNDTRTLVCCVGAGVLDSPFVGSRRRSAGGAYPKGHLAPPLRGNLRPLRRGRRPARGRARLSDAGAGRRSDSAIAPTEKPLPSAAGVTRRCHRSTLRCPKNAAHIRLLAFFDRCGNSGFASERLAAFAVPGPVSRRPANGAAAEIPVTLFLPPAARNRNPATGSAKPQFPRRGRQDRAVGATFGRPFVGHSRMSAGGASPSPTGEPPSAP